MGGRHRANPRSRRGLSHDWGSGTQDRQALWHAAGGGGGFQRGTNCQRQCRRPDCLRDWAGQEDQAALELSHEHRPQLRRDFACDSLQLTAKHKVATPVNWKPGDDVIISGSLSNDEAEKKYPGGWKAPRPYMRIVPQPK